jgi:hypothetical protein
MRLDRPVGTRAPEAPVTSTVEGHSASAGSPPFDWQDGAVSGMLGTLREHPLAGSKEPTQTCR